MGFFISTADRREPVFEHGTHSSLVRGTTTRGSNLYRVVAQAGLELPVNEETGPTVVGPT